MSADADTRYEKLEGMSHLFAAAGYSAAGLSRLWGEAAFRHEALAGVGLVAAYAWLRVSLGIALAALILFLLLIATEALNTAIEEIIDRISPEISETGRHAKDLGSLAVFCTIAANGALLLYAVALAFAR